VRWFQRRAPNARWRWRGEDWATVLEASGVLAIGENEGGKRRGGAHAQIGERGHGRRVSRRRGRVPRRAGWR
jgi:hypothetical protein